MSLDWMYSPAIFLPFPPDVVLVRGRRIVFIHKLGEFTTPRCHSRHLGVTQEPGHARLQRIHEERARDLES